MILLLRFLLAPLLVAAASLAARRWGDRVGGWLAAFPFVAGPLLLVVSLEHGPEFGASSALSALSGITALAVFAVGYAHLARVLRWFLALPLGWGLYLMSATLMHGVDMGWAARLIGALASLWIAKQLLPPMGSTPPHPPLQPPAWDIPARMGSAALLVGSVATLAQRMGPSWSGLLAPFPIATTILVVFAQALGGPTVVTRLLSGFLPALSGLAIFFATLAIGLVPLGVAPSFGIAFGASLSTQLAILQLRRRQKRRRPPLA